MLNWKNLKEKLGGMVKKFSGRKDFLEAVCAACALVASADGEVSDKEIDAAVKAAQAHAVLSANFKPGDIATTMDTMLKRASSGRVGRKSLLDELKDVSSDREMCEVAYLAAADIADADGKLDPKEVETLTLIAKTLNVSESQLGAI